MLEFELDYPVNRLEMEFHRPPQESALWERIL